MVNIPALSKRIIHIGVTLNHDMQRCDLFKHASAMAYVTLFSLIPSLAATFGLISLFKPFLGKDSELLNTAKNYILRNLATGTGEQLITYLESFLSNLDMTKIGLTGFAGLLFTLIMLLRQVEFALNRIWLVQKPRHVVIRFVYFWTFLTLGTLVVGLCIGVLSGFSIHRLNPFTHVDLSFGQKIITFLTPWFSTFLFFALLYKTVPNTVVGTRYAMYGAMIASFLLNIATAGYGLLAPAFTNYRAVYGALAALPMFLMWLYILWLITLFGALLAWRFEQSFQVNDDTDNQSIYLSETERCRNHRLQAMMPLIVLMSIHHKYRLADGLGIDSHELSHQLALPLPWIQEALGVLKEKKLIVSFVEDRSESGQLYKFFPATPGDKAKTSDVVATLQIETHRWIDEWISHFPKDLRALIKLQLQSPIASDDRTLVQMIECLPDKKAEMSPVA
jgi:membrane protein